MKYFSQIPWFLSVRKIFQKYMFFCKNINQTVGMYVKTQKF